MGTITIGDSCEVLNGYAFKSEKYTSSGIRIIRIANVQKGYIEDDSPVFYQTADVDLNKYMLRENDLLVSLTGNVGRTALLTKDMLPAALNQRVACLRLKTNKITRGFLFHLLNSDYFESKCIQSSQGVAQKNLSTEWLKSYDLPLYSLSKQNEITKILDNLRNTIILKEQEIQKYDELIKARFIEMFGDPLDGSAKYPIHQVGEVADTIDPQPSHRTPPIDESGIPYISIKDCDYKTGRIDFEGARKVGRKVLEEQSKRYTLHDGDFVIGKIGTIGNPVFIPPRDDYTLSANVVLVQPNNNLVSPYFLKYSLESDYVNRQFAEAKNSTSQAAFGIQKVRTIKVMNPDLNIQRKFDHFVKQVDKSRFDIKKSITELEREVVYD